MTLGELLLFLRESILNDRTDRTSGSSDYLWTDNTLVTFINEAQRKFAVESLILRDGTTDAATLVPLVVGQTIYDLHPAVIAVLSAQSLNSQVGLTRVGHSIFTMFRNPTDRWAEPGQYSVLPPGATQAFSTDEAVASNLTGNFSSITMRIFPAPSLASVTASPTIRLRVIRKPLIPFSLTRPDQVCELPDDHHIEMLDWAAYMALRIVDDDAGNEGRAQEFVASFEDHVTKAKKLAMAKMFAPTGWGFGRGGFSWDS
jgi:hypothetical protein